MVTDFRQDPWVKTQTLHDFPADEVISALQKEIRRGNVENAVLLSYEMLVTSPELEEKLWQRLLVISVEDIGMGEPYSPILINALFDMRGAFAERVHDRKILAVHAVRYLCSCKKDRSSDEMLSWISNQVEKGEMRPSIPDYALDMHTKRGQEMERGSRHFLEEGSKTSPELENRENKYLKKLLENAK